MDAQAVTIKPEHEASLRSMEQAIAALVVKDQASLDAATDIGVSVNEALKKLDAERRTWVDPLNAQVKRFNAHFKKLSDRLEAIKGEAKVKATAFIVAEDARKKKELEEQTLQAAAALEQQGDGAAAGAILDLGAQLADSQKTTKARTDSGGQTVTKERWVFEVSDFATLLVAAVDKPELWGKFVMADLTALRNAVAAGVREIPGVRVFSQTTTEFRR